MRKKGQNAGGAVGTVFILAVLILIYVLLLPDGPQEELLNGGQGGGQYGGGDGVVPQAVLLSQNVGRINPPAPNEVEHSIPSFTIFTSTDATELRRRSTLFVKNGIFSDQTAEMNFQFNAQTTEDVKLSFNTKRTSGNLIIELNGQEVFNSEIDNPSIAPITLHSSMLNRNNTLTFRASDPGAAFWRVNMHDLRNVIVSGKVTDKSASVSDQHFSISQQEYQAVEFAELKFLPNCDQQNAGRLRVGLNNREVYSGYADCGVPNKVEIAKDLLDQGDNTLTFVSEQGEYIVDLVKVTTKISGNEIPVFYFNLPDHIYDRVYFNDALLFISLRFADARSEKVGVLNVNGFESTFRTPTRTYQTQINPDFLSPGPNSIMIIPQGKPLDVTELRVALN